MLFTLHTEFTLAAPRAAVYAVIRDVERWPTWWRGCLAATQLAPGAADGVGARYRILWRSRLPYRVTIETEVIEVRPGTLVRARSGGDLEGFGTWHFAHAGGGTVVRYDWQVHTRKRWMRALAPLLAPLYRVNHDWLMQAGAAGLARRAGAA
jgi:uncharacterized protein YndB with AHSA1/START domain